jgi:PD-(D/E)XK nuclease superfamily
MSDTVAYADPERMDVLSASWLNRIEDCPGSWLASRGLRSPSSEDSTRGDRIHDELAARYRGDTPALPVVDGQEFEDADKMAERANDLVFQNFGDVDPDYTVERRFWMERDGTKVFSGKFDLVASAPNSDLALVIDWKTGWGDQVEPARNLQLRAGAVLFKRENPRIKRAICTLITPGTKYDPAEYDADALAQAQQHLLRLIETANDPEAPLIPSRSACQYCPAAANLSCPVAFQEMTQLTTHQPHQLEALPDELLFPMLEQALAAEVIVKKIKEAAKARCADGPRCGWEIGAGAKTSEVTDVPGAYELLAGALTGPEFASACKLQFGPLDKLMKGKWNCSLETAKKQVRTLLASVIKSGTKAGSLKRVGEVAAIDV